ncbi:MAG: sigma-54-dependent Fis family transcriptional regulator [Calditrichae bacterium]|nr:sigma-54-dependent Fis family transcriptional regulator [Calditrichota bacterium]MCB9059447.1 sigma-54-dependent Fis family transcriptional regulator [Calditrichia bacterium]
MHSILAIDDDQGFLNSIVNLLQYKNYRIDTIANPLSAIKTIDEHKYHCILLDVKMPGMEGTTLLKNIIEQFPEIPVIMVSGQSTLSIAVDCIKNGAFDFLEKPVDADRLLLTIQNALRKMEWDSERRILLKELIEQFEMVGSSSIMQRVFREIEMIAPTDAKVLIHGETGTGKELVARAIHMHSYRNTKPYVKVNCAAIPNTLVESTFFGHKKGSFSGAVSDQDGKFESAHQGTIFLDEIGELNLDVQAKLLRVLQDGEIEKIGSNSTIKIDARVIAATNKNLNTLVMNHQFREDLFHRLNVVTIQIPPLRERKEDIPILVRYFIKKFSERYNKQLLELAPSAMNVLFKQQWPGNVRQLENIIEKITIFAREPVVHVNQVVFALESAAFESEVLSGDILPLKDYMDKTEREYIERVLMLAENKKSYTSELLGLDRTALWKKMQKYNLE